MRSTRNSRLNPLHFVAYYRVSTQRQGESGLGLEAQKTAVSAHVSARKGNLAAEFTEIESGKRHENRPQLESAIAEAKRRGATLLIAKLDRLARNVHFISGLMESAAAFEACDMPAANKLTIHLMAAVAEHEREMISTRTKAALTAAKQRGTKLGNPRWQESIEKARAARRPAPSIADLVQIMRRLREQGNSYRAIAGKLNALELKTPGRSAWYASTVRAALRAS